MPTGAFFHREKGEEGKVLGWTEAEPGSSLPLPPLPALPCPHGLQERGHRQLDVPVCLQCQGDKLMGTGRESNLSMIGVSVHCIAATASVQKTGGCHGEEKEMCFTSHHGRWLVSLWDHFSLDAAKYLTKRLETFQAHHFASVKDHAISVCSRRELLSICQTKVNIKSITVGKEYNV